MCLMGPVVVFQARRTQQQVHSLQAENQSLQLNLEDTQRHCRQLEDTARTHTRVSVFMFYILMFAWLTHDSLPLSLSLVLSVSVCLSVGHVCPAGGAVCVADGGSDS